MLENGVAKKTSKNLSPKCRQEDGFGVQMGWVLHAGDAPKIIKIRKFAKMDPRDVPGPKKRSKGTQKAPKKHPNGIQKPSQKYSN